MAGMYNGRYAQVDPGSGITVVSMEDGEFNMFGSCTRIRTTQWESYPEINDEPTVLQAEDHIKEKLLTGLVESVALASVATTVRVTEGAALELLVCALGGVATGSGTGYTTGAAVYGIRAAASDVSLPARTQAGMIPRGSSFTAAVVLDIAVAGQMPANDICSNNNSYRVVLDRLFNKDSDAYEIVVMALAMSIEVYTNTIQNNLLSENRKNDSDEEGLFLESLSDHYGDQYRNRKGEMKYKILKRGRHVDPKKWRHKKFDADGGNPDRWDNFKTGITDGWYSDIAAGTAPGSVTDEIFVQSTKSTDKEKYPDIYVYDGLPWEPDSNTYFFDLRKARKDVWPLYEKAGVSKGMLSSMLMSSPVSIRSSEVTYEGQYAATIDGIPALGVGVWPAMWKNYYSEYAMKTIKMDDISANWTYKIAIVVVDKGEDVSDPSKWKYVPATRVSSKAHTFYGGVLQTNVTLTDEGEIISTESNSGYTGNTTIGNVSSYGRDEASIVRMVKDIKEENGHLGDWWVHYVEVYNIGDNMNNINHNYDFVGYVIYGDTFMNMS